MSGDTPPEIAREIRIFMMTVRTLSLRRRNNKTRGRDGVAYPFIQVPSLISLYLLPELITLLNFRESFKMKGHPL